MTRVNFVVEGETEESFVNNVLKPYFATQQLYCTARRVETGRRHGKISRGGTTTYEKAKRDVIRWLKEDTTAYLTTMFDLYALPADFPKFNESKFVSEPRKKVEQLEQAFYDDVNEQRFIPYIQLHEFEALLFSDVEKIDNRLKIYSKSKLNELFNILNKCGEPELINEGEKTAPSKRLQSLYPTYQKPIFGVLISQDIGLQTIRNKCPHFDAWLKKIETVTK